jgi:hypothetical protein
LLARLHDNRFRQLWLHLRAVLEGASRLACSPPMDSRPNESRAPSCAPRWQDDHDFLIELMEGVEDIPGTALHEGISWDWETFPEFLDHLASLPAVMDFCPALPGRLDGLSVP